MFTAATIISLIGGFYVARPCAQINYLYGEEYTLSLYPDCRAYYTGTNPDQHVVVEANYYSATDAFQLAASLGYNFGASGWLALWLHAIAIEAYLHLTPAESQRLRQVSYERQLERGFKNAGSAGLVAERLGDAKPYVPQSHTNNTYPQGDEEELDILPKRGRTAVDVYSQ